jgi:hypothetical protein
MSKDWKAKYFQSIKNKKKSVQYKEAIVKNTIPILICLTELVSG